MGSLDVDRDMLTEQQIIELEQVYEKLIENQTKPFAFPEMARKHSKLINEVLPKSKFSDFIKRAFIVIEFKDRMIQVLSIFNYADLRSHNSQKLLPNKQPQIKIRAASSTAKKRVKNRNLIPKTPLNNLEQSGSIINLQTGH
jgi:hypothetical protein